MKVALFAFVAPLLATAECVLQPTPPQSSSRPAVPSAFTVVASRHGSPIDQLPWEAGGLRFRLGGQASTYCPTMVGPNCPPGVDTAIAGLNYMDVMVPGGQQMYVEPGGAVGYTQAHSAFIPPGSAISGFTLTPGLGPHHARYSFNGLGANGFMACPSADRSYYQVFAAMENATVPTGNVGDCVKFQAVATAYTSSPFAAWQYT